MKRVVVWVVFAALLLLITTVKADKGGVTFWRTEVAMTCPGKGTWYKNKDEKSFAEDTDVETLKYDENTEGLYYCTYKDSESENQETYYFYVRGKACENCFELNATLVAGVIVADVVGTTIVMFVIFKCTKRKNSAGSTQTTKTPHSAGRAPPVPSPDYAPLSAHTRSQDPYSEINRMG